MLNPAQSPKTTISLNNSLPAVPQPEGEGQQQDTSEELKAQLAKLNERLGDNKGVPLSSFSATQTREFRTALSGMINAISAVGSGTFLNQELKEKYGKLESTRLGVSYLPALSNLGERYRELLKSREDNQTTIAETLRLYSSTREMYRDVGQVIRQTGRYYGTSKKTVPEVSTNDQLNIAVLIVTKAVELQQGDEAAQSFAGDLLAATRNARLALVGNKALSAEEKGNLIEAYGRVLNREQQERERQEQKAAEEKKRSEARDNGKDR